VRVLVTGSREFDNEDTIVDALLPFLDAGAVVVHGACPTGADRITSQLCEELAGHYDNVGLAVSEEPHPADWKGYGKAAGFIRNAEMVALGADVCLAFYKVGARNRGTDHCAGQAERSGIPVHRIYA
jgi:hypothetical protein